MTDAEGSVEPELVDDGQLVGGEAMPVEVEAGGQPGEAVTALVDGDASVAAREAPGERGEGHAVETGGVGQDDGPAAPSELVEGDFDAVGAS